MGLKRYASGPLAGQPLTAYPYAVGAWVRTAWGAVDEIVATPGPYSVYLAGHVVCPVSLIKSQIPRPRGARSHFEEGEKTHARAEKETTTRSPARDGVSRREPAQLALDLQVRVR